MTSDTSFSRAHCSMHPERSQQKCDAVLRRERDHIQRLRAVRRQIGGNIWRLRQRRRMTIRKLSQLSGVPEWRIDQYELGKNEIGVEELLRLSCAMQVDWVTTLAGNHK